MTPILDFCLLLCLKARKITHPHEKQNRYFEMEYKEGMRVWPGFLAGSNQEEEDAAFASKSVEALALPESPQDS